MRFLLDANMPRSATALFVGHGHDAHRYPPKESPGYLVIRVPDTWIASEINELLSRFLGLTELVEQIPGHLVMLDPRRVRFRPALEMEHETDE